MRANDGEACTSTNAALLEKLREADLGADEQLALLNVHQFTELAADRAMRLLVPAHQRPAYLGPRAELATALRGWFCLTLQLGATHHDARAKRARLNPAHDAGCRALVTDPKVAARGCTCLARFGAPCPRCLELEKQIQSMHSTILTLDPPEGL